MSVERFDGSILTGNAFNWPAKFVGISLLLLHNREVRKHLVRRRTDDVFVSVRKAVPDAIREENIRDGAEHGKPGGGAVTIRPQNDREKISPAVLLARLLVLKGGGGSTFCEDGEVGTHGLACPANRSIAKLSGVTLIRGGQWDDAEPFSCEGVNVCPHESCSPAILIASNKRAIGSRGITGNVGSGILANVIAGRWAEEVGTARIASGFLKGGTPSEENVEAGGLLANHDDVVGRGVREKKVIRERTGGELHSHADGKRRRTPEWSAGDLVLERLAGNEPGAHAHVNAIVRGSRDCIPDCRFVLGRAEVDIIPALVERRGPTRSLYR